MALLFEGVREDWAEMEPYMRHRYVIRRFLFWLQPMAGFLALFQLAYRGNLSAIPFSVSLAAIIVGLHFLLRGLRHGKKYYPFEPYISVGEFISKFAAAFMSTAMVYSIDPLIIVFNAQGVAPVVRGLLLVPYVLFAISVPLTLVLLELFVRGLKAVYEQISLVWDLSE